MHRIVSRKTTLTRRRLSATLSPPLRLLSCPSSPRSLLLPVKRTAVGVCRLLCRPVRAD